VIKGLVFLLPFLLATATEFTGQSYPEIPTPLRLVNNLAGILELTGELLLEQKPVAYDDSTTTQIAIVTMKDLGGISASVYATGLANKWGIGQEAEDNGILILVSLSNPREMFISTGYGIEAIISDAEIKEIVDNDIIPAFNQGNYYVGLDKATSELIFRLRGKFKNEKTKR